MIKNDKIMDRGFIQIYTGDGKGKTTAGLGLALRAAGHGYKTFIGQFMKGQYYGELSSLKNLSLIDIEQFGDEVCIRRDEVTDMHRKHGQDGIDRIWQVMKSGQYNIIIMDEICVSIWFGIVGTDAVLDIMKAKPYGVELVLTGRKAPEVLIEAADLVTEMKEIKHYYTKGILARDGIER